MEWKLFADLAEAAGARQVAVDVDPEADATVADALDALLAGRPALEDRLRDEDGALRDHVSVLRNGTRLDDGALDEAVAPGDELALVPPVSGG